MPELVPGFVKVTEAGREYKTSRSTLDRRREAARDSAAPKLYRVFRLRAKDGEVFEQPTKEQVAQLTKEGRVPEWYVSHSWLAKEFGKRADEGRAGVTAQGADREPQQTSGLLSVVHQQYEERIKDLKEQLDAARQEKKELLQYAQADKQMFAQAAQQLTQVLALPAIAEANKNRTSSTVQADAPQSDQTDSRAAGDRNGTLPPAPLASKENRLNLFRFFKRP